MKRIELEVGERVLSNGLTLIAVRNPGVSTFAATVALRVSQLHEGAKERGLAYLTGECLDEGSEKRPATTFAEAVESIGARLTCGPSGGTIQCPADEAARATRLLREAVLEPALEAREVKRVQQEVAAEIEAEAADPFSVSRWRFRAENYGEHPMGRPPWSHRDDVLAIRPGDLRRWHQKYFYPEGGYVAVAGPADVEESLDLCAKVFRSFRGKTVPRPELPEIELPSAARDIHLPMKREQVHVWVGHRGVRRKCPDFVALQVMDHILGSGPGFTSRITQRLRDQEGLCYSVHAGITGTAAAEPGLFAAYIGTSPQHRDRAVAGFIEEIEKLRAEEPSEQEVADVRDYLTGSFVLGLERNTNLITYAIRAHRFGLGYDWVHRYRDLVAKITPAEVQRVATEYLHPDRAITVSAGSSVEATSR